MGNPHVLVIPFPAQGHVLPLMELSQCLVNHGIRITFVNTQENHKRVMDALVMKDGMGDQFHLVSIPLVQESSENTGQLAEKLVEAILWLMPKKVEELIEQINASDSDKITCVLADPVLNWAMEIAAKKGIRRAVFYCAAATQLVLRSRIQKLIDDGIVDDDGIPKKEMFQLSPTMPVMSTAHIGFLWLGTSKMQRLFFENTVKNNPSIQLAEWVLCNSTHDLEPAAFNTDPKFKQIGPLLARNRFGDSAGSFWPEDLTCLKWLDQQPAQSVVYIAFGSTTIFDQTQFQELFMGLELSNRPFLWVVRSDIAAKINDAYLKGLQDRFAPRGHIVSWAPQQKVLAHPSIACFISHCGWNSTMEGISNGVPFLCWPYFADQKHNENYICNVWNVGLGFSKDESGIITREEIKSKLEELLDNGKYKGNALDLKESLMNNIKEGGCSYNNFKHFVEWLKT
ncbi:UDP-glycosyltransferase 83A1-like [Pistacia vera]|uniref:UDP-glycosyltransferase 83A1-like n=1 Tax=Pistacia vera TaxID=55513 RepID=UPI0012635100|nr:UDP-glycosyltransferase 83A1-like [Pistacia vera]XP_031262822.1 UDP-glycosyltransferase 83A1-like [Pistacia vera]